MSRTALIRLGPAVSLDLINSDAARRNLYEDVKLLDYLPPRPVCVDHDEDRKVGEVLNLFTAPDTALYPVVVPWLCARVRLFDDAPGWIRKGTGASISTKAGFKSDVFGWPVNRHAFLDEVTVCSAATTPREPLASVVFIQDEKPKPAPAPRVVAPAPASPLRSRYQQETAELRRRIDAAEAAAGHPVDPEPIIQALKIELGYSGRSALAQYHAAFFAGRTAA